ncbi:Hsp70 family protein [Umezawaea tangerina]|uniref:Hsp70 protein n=1 Tax=Umezawaea tangerina TaxID=84725 RepID=A0A2T0TLM0_9PSEU|nr:Hsp70 family protein [Umezawaea tangerina]PRY46511.1 Hsp70 protein [Umezawaea tangerina]
MPYVLGVDVGTTRTAAAICRLARVGRPEVEVVGLGGPGGGVSSTLRLTPEGDYVVGDPGDPLLTATGFARRVGDDVPVLLGQDWVAPEDLTALMVMYVAAQVAEREGEQATHVAVTHPADWGQHRKDLLAQALRQVGIERPTLVAEPIAAVENHLAAGGGGEVQAVFSLGSHAVEASVVRRSLGTAAELLGANEGHDHRAGVDFDDVVLGHVRAELGRDLADLDPADPWVAQLVTRLRFDCEAAKRALSAMPEVTIPVHLEEGVREVRLTRPRFEDMIRPALDLAVDTLVRTTAAHAAPDVVLLVGGSARIPLVADLVSGAVRARLAIEAAPETSVVKGAALVARQAVEGPDAEPEPRETSVLRRFDDPSLRFPVGELGLSDDEFTAPPPRPPVDITPLDLPERRSVKRVVRGLKPAGAGGSRRGGPAPDEDDR